MSRRRPHHCVRVPAWARLALLLAAAACGDPSGPADRKVSIAVLTGDAQLGLPGTPGDPLQVLVIDAATREPRSGVTVTWQVTGGAAALGPLTASTDSRGIATTTIRLPSSIGTSTITASAAGQVGDKAVFTVAAVNAPVITGIAPASARAGDTVTITGTNFGSALSSLAVRFDGIRGMVVSGAPDRIRVIVPACVTTHSAAVLVSLGTAISAPASMNTVAGGTASLRLERGDVRVFAEPAALSCVRLPADPAGASYLIIAQNAADTYSTAMPFELAALGVIPPPIALRAASTGSASFASDWELRLRAAERALLAAHAPELPRAAISEGGAVDPPKVGDRRAFNTLNAQSQTVKITAEVRAVTARAILYQDVAAPNVLTAADYERFGELFDDPIYGTTTAAFGPVSDNDDNDRIIMVFTPQVNRLTPKGTGSYIAGYFYACDLLSPSRCSASNGGEIFYSIVPDPAGTVGTPHSAANVLRTVPPVLAHELVHMINFSERGSQDVLWLGEALAHSAEDLVGQVLLDRGEDIAPDFINQNQIHARLYLASIARTSLIANESPGTIELRGAGWLFLRYLRGHYGGDALLRSLTTATESGVRNITTRTGRTWSSLLSDFAVAIYADDAPTMTGVPVDPRFTFTNLNLRTMSPPTTSFPLAIRTYSFSDFLATGELPSSSWQYHYVQVPANGTALPLNMVFSGPRGGPFTNGSVPQLTILRVR